MTYSDLSYDAALTDGIKWNVLARFSSSGTAAVLNKALWELGQKLQIKKY